MRAFNILVETSNSKDPAENVRCYVVFLWVCVVGVDG